MKQVIILIALILLSCEKNKVLEPKKVNNFQKTKQFDSIIQKKTTFDLNTAHKIKDFKTIDFKNKRLNFGIYLKETNIENWIKSCEKYNNIYISDSLETIKKEFSIKTDYTDLLFKNIDDGEYFLQYNYCGFKNSINAFIVFISTIDIPTTLFIDKNNPDKNFIVNGEVFFSKKENYFIAISNQPDYCIIEIYQINEKKIINVCNLYSDDIFINKICWSNNLILETVLTNNEHKYFIINFDLIINDFKPAVRSL